MAVTIVTGDLATDTINASQRIVDMDPKVEELEPNAAPLVLLLKKLRNRTANAPKVEWMEIDPMPRFDTASANALSSATTFGVNNIGYFRVGDVARMLVTGEAVEITATAANTLPAGTLTITRAIGGTIAGAITSGDEVFIYSNVNAEGASLRQIKTVKLVNASNYTQIIRTPLGVTGTEAATKLYGGPDLNRLRGAAGVEHMRQWEQVAFFGAKKEDLGTTGSPKRFAGGLKEFITTNITNVGGALSEATLQTFLRSGFRYGSDRKILFASPLVVAALEGYMRTNIKVNNEANNATYGVAMKEYVSGQGVVDIVMHRSWNDSTTLRGYAFLVDIDAITYSPLRDTKLLEGRQANDADKIEEEYLTEATFQVFQERRHALMTGITG